MGENTLEEQINSETVASSDVNQFRTALLENHVPRNSSGSPEDEAGSLGSSSLKWFKTHIQGGCWSAGDIKPHHTFSGAAPITNGWFPCNGSIINQENYDILFGENAWDDHIKSSPLEGRYSPSMLSRYIKGSSDTTQDGNALITQVGFDNHLLNFAHIHTSPAHQHQWHTNTAFGYSLLNRTTPSHYNMSFAYGGAKKDFTVNAGGFSGFYYTENETVSTDYQSIESKTIQPHSIEVIYYIRII